MSNRINLDDPNYDQNQNRVTVQDNKAKMLWAVLGVIAVIVIIFVITLQSGSNGSSSKNSNSSSPDPNRTSEQCSLYGTAKVYPSTYHDNCIPDGDGYFLMGFGHHHHK